MKIQLTWYGVDAAVLVLTVRPTGASLVGAGGQKQSNNAMKWTKMLKETFWCHCKIMQGHGLGIKELCKSSHHPIGNIICVIMKPDIIDQIWSDVKWKWAIEGLEHGCESPELKRQYFHNAWATIRYYDGLQCSAIRKVGTVHDWFITFSFIQLQCPHKMSKSIIGWVNKPKNQLLN